MQAYSRRLVLLVVMVAAVGALWLIPIRVSTAAGSRDPALMHENETPAATAAPMHTHTDEHAPAATAAPAHSHADEHAPAPPVHNTAATAAPLATPVPNHTHNDAVHHMDGESAPIQTHSDGGTASHTHTTAAEHGDEVPLARRWLVLGGFLAINTLVLLAAAMLKRRTVKRPQSRAAA